MKESRVEANLKKYLLKKGWSVSRKCKRPGEHGCDVIAAHPSWRKRLFIEVKGGSGRNKHQEIHSGFYTVLGQLLSRMTREGNHPNRGRIYGIGIPHSWAAIYKKKILKMPYGWRLLKPRVFLVKWNGVVVEKTYSYFLKTGNNR